MGIKEKTLSLFEDSCRNSERGLKTICEAEKYLQQAYEGRYFFELIQNVRDANKEASQEGDIYIELKDNVLSIANTGAPFSEEGIASITSIGQSPKQSLDFMDSKVLVLNRRWKFQIHLVSLPLKGLYILIGSLRWKC